jgi:hypothetical protein
MPQIKKNKSGEFKLFFDDEEVVASLNFIEHRGEFALTSDESSTTEQLLNYKFNELKKICFLEFSFRTEWSETLRKVSIKGLKPDRFNIIFEFDGRLKKWGNKKKYFSYFNGLVLSIAEFNMQNSLIRDFRKLNIVEINPIQDSSYGFEIIFPAKKLPLILKEEVVKCLEILHYFHKQVLKLTDAHYKESIFISAFNFPAELKVSCEQYLLYFAKFLRDLGINATSNLKEEAGKVLFSVTPTDDVEALDKIREALAVYLNLPSSPIVYNESFAAMRLQQQIENLQHSQRMAARELQFNEKLLVAQSEIIKEKNITISQLQSNHKQQSRIIEKITNPKIMMDSVENKEELEKIYDGLEIGKSKTLVDWLGLHFNPAKLIKTSVKNAFGKEGKTITILGLNEETKKENN